MVRHLRKPPPLNYEGGGNYEDAFQRGRSVSVVGNRTAAILEGGFSACLPRSSV